MSRLKLYLFLFSLIPVVLGCAVGNKGMIAGKVSHYEGTSLMELYSIGLHARTRTDDSGIHLGFSKRDYYFFNEDIQSGWYLFNVPFQNSESVAQSLKTYGIDISFTPPESGISVGYQQTVFQARVSPWSSFHIEYLDNKIKINEVKQK